MFEAHIYISTDSSSSKITEKHYEYVLECCLMSGKTARREGKGKTKGTYHQATLTAMTEALKRFNQSCEIYIHMQDGFVLNMMGHNLDRWAGNGFLTSRGEPVANQKEWMKLWTVSRGQLIHLKHETDRRRVNE